LELPQKTSKKKVFLQKNRFLKILKQKEYFYVDMAI